MAGSQYNSFPHGCLKIVSAQLFEITFNYRMR
jgi:hypothetical protein